MPKPYGRAIAVGAMFVVVGLVVWLLIPQLIARQLHPPADPRLSCAVVGFALVAIGCYALAWVITAGSRRRPFRHATDDVLPEVPREPVLIDGTIFHGALRHHLIQHGKEWHLAPDPACARRERRFLLWFTVPFALLMEVVLWFALADDGLLRWLSMAVGVIVTAISIPFITWLMAAMGRQTPTLVLPEGGGDLLFLRRGQTPATLALVKRLSGTCELPPALREEAHVIPRSAVIAVQLCACHGIIAGKGGRSVHEGIELNLVGRDDRGALRRLTLCTVGLGETLAHLGAALAGRLDVPLLHHATAADWAEERARAQHRPPMSVGGSSS